MSKAGDILKSFDESLNLDNTKLARLAYYIVATKKIWAKIKKEGRGLRGDKTKDFEPIRRISSKGDDTLIKIAIAAGADWNGFPRQGQIDEKWWFEFIGRSLKDADSKLLKFTVLANQMYKRGTKEEFKEYLDNVEKGIVNINRPDHRSRT